MSYKEENLKKTLGVYIDLEESLIKDICTAPGVGRARQFAIDYQATQSIIKTLKLEIADLKPVKSKK